MVIATERLGPVYSNIPLLPQWRLDPRGPAGPRATSPPERSGPWHIMIDFGDDELTAGRPHPMIDQRLRLDRLAAEAADPATSVIMLDVVLGHGAHPDPAAEIGPAIAAARAARASSATPASSAAPASGATRTPGAARSEGDLAIVVSLVGARSDPQGLTAQATALAAAGAHAFASNAQAARFACDLAGQGRSGGTA
jgi:FdrA protein